MVSEMIKLWKLDPWGGVSLDPMVLIGKIYVEDQ